MPWLRIRTPIYVRCQLPCYLRRRSARPAVSSLVKMPYVTVNSEGAQLYYEDSGPPPGKEVYTTLVLAHGTGFHCGESTSKLYHPPVPLS